MNLFLFFVCHDPVFDTEYAVCPDMVSDHLFQTRAGQERLDPADAVQNDDDEFDEDKLTEESYRTTYETDPEDLNFEAESISDDYED